MSSSPSAPTLAPEALEVCLEVLQAVSEDVGAYSHEERLKALITKIYRQARRLERRRPPAASAALVPVPRRQRPCYICKQPYADQHPLYHRLCPECAQLNWAKRQQRTDLAGRIALVTGGRIKIGHQTALRLLRDGARVVVTTRFPHDCLERFACQSDHHDWSQRLQVFGLDLRDIPALEATIARLQDSLPHLDILINNAAQTIKRPPEFYRHLLPGVQASLEFPAGLTDVYGQPLDLRPVNSWVATADQVSTCELLEVTVVNAVAPFLLVSRLKSLLARSPFARRFIVNVSAMEGQFARLHKTVRHPHTNMAKAALNMLTRTSAADYAQDGIFMNSVDTGWITDENPYPKAIRMREREGFYPPLDLLDGMARIYDPIVIGLGDEPPVYGQFLKDYRPCPW